VEEIKAIVCARDEKVDVGGGKSESKSSAGRKGFLERTL
jgi:hypothetical protein